MARRAGLLPIVIQRMQSGASAVHGAATAGAPPAAGKNDSAASARNVAVVISVLSSDNPDWILMRNAAQLNDYEFDNVLIRRRDPMSPRLRYGIVHWLGVLTWPASLMAARAALRAAPSDRSARIRAGSARLVASGHLGPAGAVIYLR
jgi:hypothetical protein